uniref:hypothetical protein n=1 Tax=Streptomyces tubercidicus TaxID=47759 RepID=UPI0037DCA9F7
MPKGPWVVVWLHRKPKGLEDQSYLQSQEARSMNQDRTTVDIRSHSRRSARPVVPIRNQADEALWRVRSDKVRPLADALTAFITAADSHTAGPQPAPVATLALNIPGFEDRLFGAYQLTPHLADVLARAFNLAALDLAATQTATVPAPTTSARPLHLVTGGAR